MCFDYRKYLEPLEKWIEQAKKQKAYSGFGQCLMSVPDNVLEPIELLVKNYKYLREEESKKKED